MMILGADQIDVEALMKSAAARAEEMCRELHQNDPEEKERRERKELIAWERKLMRKALERYRTEQPDSTIRKVVDMLIRQHADMKEVYGGDSTFSDRHNALVLKYIIANPFTNAQLCERFHLSHAGLDKWITKGINELAELFFGVHFET